ncbi:MAG: hypothetical protein CBB97_18370 [Candidatus Endolissoclinum sp. TMED37]|nr:MAG: hypothetical protein CBB97_18370 [Candidatus Endolissoclinum sp. TMED37]
MLESGNFVDIRFQEEPRYKKPAGTYWLQAASVNLLSPSKLKEIWPYRIPSLLAAIIAVIGTYFLANVFLRPPGGIIAAIILSSTPLLIGEAHMAKSDALLLASVVIAQFGLIRTYRNHVSWLNWLCLWGGIGLGVMIKGPVTPLVIFLTVLVVSIIDREVKWVLKLRPLSGFSLVACICLPWIISIQIQSSGEFLQSSLGQDLLPKLLSGVESHGLPPGYYLLLALITLWPGSLFIYPALKFAINSRKTNTIKFLFAWVIPTWVMLEIIPTKLPHYVLPLYPAIAIIISYWMTNVAKKGGHKSSFSLNAIEVAIIGVIWFVVGLSFLLVSNFLQQTKLLTPELVATPELIFSKFNEIDFLVLNFATIINSLMFVFLLLVAYALFLFRKYVLSLSVSVSLVWLFVIPVLQWSIPDLKWLFPSKQVAQIIEEHSGGKYPLVAIGYHEPSLVFYNGSGTALANPEEGVKALLNNPYSYALVTKGNLDKFLDRLLNKNVSIEKIKEIKSFNYSKGRAISLLIFFCSSIELR